MASAEPGHDCPLCPRLAEFRGRHRASHPAWFNGPVPAFGGDDAELLIVGLAPGLQGANRTGRPFTGDYAGDLLYATLLKFGLGRGRYGARPDDGYQLIRTRITNAVRCVPPENKPTPAEIRTCNGYLAGQIGALPRLRAIVALGRIAHDATLTALKLRKAAHPFGHGAEHAAGAVRLFDSYHCSRYNTNTGVLTPAMFEAVFGRVAEHLGSAASPR
jgi:uracil-DNA glycosylase family 4